MAYVGKFFRKRKRDAMALSDDYNASNFVVLQFLEIIFFLSKHLIRINVESVR